MLKVMDVSQLKPLSLESASEKPAVAKTDALPKALRVLCCLPEYALAVLMVALTVLLVLGVVFRYFLYLSIDWSEEAARVLFIWVCFLGAAVCVKRGTHLGVDIITSRFPARVQHYVRIIDITLIIMFSVFLIFQGLETTRTAFLQELPVLEIPIGWLYLALPVSAGLMLVYSVAHLIAEFKKR